MIDPWRHLNGWNKPANKNDDVFEQFLIETKSKTDFAAKKRILLRGTTTEVVEGIPDNELDFAYIHGDHTLKGIAIDLIRLFPKIRLGDGLEAMILAEQYGSTPPPLSQLLYSHLLSILLRLSVLISMLCHTISF